VNPESFNGHTIFGIFQEIFSGFRVPAIQSDIDHRLIERSHPGINDRYFEAVLEACGLDFMDGFDDDDPEEEGDKRYRAALARFNSAVSELNADRSAVEKRLGEYAPLFNYYLDYIEERVRRMGHDVY
jgi:hypothetical protein